MNPANLAPTASAAGEGEGFLAFLRGVVFVFRVIPWTVRELATHPLIGIPVGILTICALIFVVVRRVR